MLNSCFEYRFSENLVDIDSCQLRCHLRHCLELSCEEAHVGLLGDREAIFLLLFQVVSDHLSRLETVTEGHVHVHNDQCVARARSLETVLDHIKTFLAVCRQVILNLELVELCGHG